ncbi:hypothetical protein [Microbacterium trichothecenolyticum]|uniref:Gram-positive cocci surface proteins LPxTG domain-containing protein n=1 Tax=Microbacterium trichothecenolyticum TaxID=69370 RepID=A0ABU0TU32_MICTR|nr:hypothetical protein [Microbacterium trichothecenolyticum]MDQ1123149.1 hypothetical protein [Microbacterium trichothecenolyticum]
MRALVLPTIAASVALTIVAVTPALAQSTAEPERQSVTIDETTSDTGSSCDGLTMEPPVATGRASGRIQLCVTVPAGTPDPTPTPSAGTDVPETGDGDGDAGHGGIDGRALATTGSSPVVLLAAIGVAALAVAVALLRRAARGNTG